MPAPGSAHRGLSPGATALRSFRIAVARLHHPKPALRARRVEAAARRDGGAVIEHAGYALDGLERVVPRDHERLARFGALVADLPGAGR